MKRYIHNLLHYFKYLRQYFIYSIFNRYFYFDGTKIRYSKAFYNSVDSERVIEIPIAKYYLEKYGKNEVLEVGNVLSYYFNFPHDIIDKYEIADGVINEDIAEFKFNKKYNLIISISTLEHVGFDEPIKEYGKVDKSIKNLLKALKPGGKILITMPCGYNPEVDKIVEANPYNFKMTFYKRNALNVWKITDKQNALSSKYGSKYNAANSLVVIEISN